MHGLNGNFIGKSQVHTHTGRSHTAMSIIAEPSAIVGLYLCACCSHMKYAYVFFFY